MTGELGAGPVFERKFYAGFSEEGGALEGRGLLRSRQHLLSMYHNFRPQRQC